MEVDGDATGEVEKPEAAVAEHCFFCFDVLDAKLRSKSLPTLDTPDCDEEFPLFVTWNTMSSKPGGTSRLRGCIGNFEPMALGDGLRDYAIISALKDRRFSPIQLKELPKLECGVSLLTDFEVCSDPFDWDIGTHGIYIHFTNPAHNPPPVDSGDSTPSSSTPPSRQDSEEPKRATRLPKLPFASPADRHKGPHTMSATYLPDVAHSQGWTQTETLDSAIRKAGYSGRITPALRNTLRVTRYQSSHYTVTYEEWIAARHG